MRNQEIVRIVAAFELSMIECFLMTDSNQRKEEEEEVEQQTKIEQNQKSCDRNDNHVVLMVFTKILF